MRYAVLLVLLASIAAPVFADDAIELRGRLVQGSLLLGRTRSGARVTFDGRPVRVSARGELLIGLAPDAHAHATIVVIDRDGRRSVRELTIARRSYATRSLRGLPGELVHLRGELRRRQEEGEAALRTVRRADRPHADFRAGFSWPARGPITARYGDRRVLDGTPSEPHWAIDIALAPGSPVRAPSDGIVAFARELPIYGRTLVIDHGHGLTSSLLHLARVSVPVGERVRRGQIVAESGASGRATGPHLDWRVYLFESPLDPESIISGPRG